MSCIKKTIPILFVVLLMSPQFLYAKRGTQTWNNLLESSEIIASAFLFKIESNVDNNKHVAYFKIDRIYKGEKIKDIEIVSDAVSVKEDVYLNELGNYIIFLKKSTSANANYSLEPERFLKCSYLRDTKGRLIEAVDENSYHLLTNIPNELFSEEDIRLTVYGKQFDYKAKIINYRSIERWFEKNYLNFKT